MGFDDHANLSLEILSGTRLEAVAEFLRCENVRDLQEELENLKHSCPYLNGSNGILAVN